MEENKVLIVDDDANLATLLEARLKAANYRVRTANNVEDALQVFLSFKPNLVLTDIGLGEESGLDLIKRIRQQGGNFRTIYMTGDTIRYRTALAQEKKLFHAEVLAKPFKYNELVSVVSNQSRPHPKAA